MQLNPYAPPRSAVEAPPPQACWRDGKVLVMQPGTSLPNRCVKCNAAALEPIRSRWIYWHHPAWYLLVLINVVLYAIVALVVRKRQQIAPGLCAGHRNRRRMFLAIGWIGFLLGFMAIPVGISGDQPGIAIVGVIAMGLSMLAGVSGGRIVYPALISKTEIRLKGCGSAFLNSLESR
jgi:hypothetical protein